MNEEGGNRKRLEAREAAGKELLFCLSWVTFMISSFNKHAPLGKNKSFIRN